MSSPASGKPLQVLLQEASAHLQQRSFSSAQALLDEAARLEPQVRDVRMLQAILAVQTRQAEKAEQIFKGLLQDNPSDVDALANLGYLLLQAERTKEARELLERAVRLQPRHAGLHLNLGVALEALGHTPEALQSYQRSLALDPRDAQTHYAAGKLLQRGQDYQAAFASYQRALSLNPSHSEALSNLLFTHHYLEDFSPLINSAWARRFAPPASAAHERTASRGLLKPPLKVGFVSADLRQHPVGYFLEAVLRELDRSRLSLFAYSNNIFEDEVSARLKPHFAQWHVIESLNDQDASALIQQDEIDVLIDLSGYTAGHRQSLFSLRPAPLQLSWLGYFSTTGQSAMDYVLADPVSVPPQEENLFSERVWRMPVIRYCFTPPENAPEVARSPAAERGQITFGSFQALEKINNRVLRAWAEILKGVPGARLRIQSSKFDHPSSRSEFERRLLACGLPLEQVQLAAGQSRSDYLAAYKEVDLVLDTFPYPGGTTTVEALWMGVPTLTLALPGMLGRQGQSIMSAAGLPDWAVTTEADYVARALHWAQSATGHPVEWAELRKNLRDQVQASALFNATQFARDFEQALEGMWQDTSGSRGSAPQPLNATPTPKTP
ncbi:O-linked N-acetylglucosamine transferase family protein [Ottowia thiooxydans]|uniref:protein O-GlcNAc transferase n=1 Tax=Ottowia thiooxydans TaxID=219182 RepID=A0ABV2Q263_9BURK